MTNVSSQEKVSQPLWTSLLGPRRTRSQEALEGSRLGEDFSAFRRSVFLKVSNAHVSEEENGGHQLSGAKEENENVVENPGDILRI